MARTSSCALTAPSRSASPASPHPHPPHPLHVEGVGAGPTSQSPAAGSGSGHVRCPSRGPGLALRSENLKVRLLVLDGPQDLGPVEEEVLRLAHDHWQAAAHDVAQYDDEEVLVEPNAVVDGGVGAEHEADGGEGHVDDGVLKAGDGEHHDREPHGRRLQSVLSQLEQPHVLICSQSHKTRAHQLPEHVPGLLSQQHGRADQNVGGNRSEERDLLASDCQ
jgi:hypothetical protein